MPQEAAACPRLQRPLCQQQQPALPPCQLLLRRLPPLQQAAADDAASPRPEMQALCFISIKRCLLPGSPPYAQTTPTMMTAPDNAVAMCLWARHPPSSGCAGAACIAMHWCMAAEAENGPGPEGQPAWLPPAPGAAGAPARALPLHPSHPIPASHIPSWHLIRHYM